MINTKIKEGDMFADTPKPPYYAVIFTSKLAENKDGYAEMSEIIEASVKEQAGYLGMESARNELGITVCYWRDMDSIRLWSENVLHKEAKKMGKSTWYQNYKVRISKVEVEY